MVPVVVEGVVVATVVVEGVVVTMVVGVVVLTVVEGAPLLDAELELPAVVPVFKEIVVLRLVLAVPVVVTGGAIVVPFNIVSINHYYPNNKKVSHFSQN